MPDLATAHYNLKYLLPFPLLSKRSSSLKSTSKGKRSPDHVLNAILPSFYSGLVPANPVHLVHHTVPLGWGEGVGKYGADNYHRLTSEMLAHTLSLAVFTAEVKSNFCVCVCSTTAYLS